MIRKACKNGQETKRVLYQLVSDKQTIFVYELVLLFEVSSEVLKKNSNSLSYVWNILKI